MTDYLRNATLIRPLNKGAGTGTACCFNGTLLAVSSVTTNSSGYNTTSVTPIGSYLHLLYVINTHASAPTQPTVTGQNFATWVRITNRAVSTSQMQNWFRARGSTPATGTLRISFGAATQTGVFYHESVWRNVWGENNVSDFGSAGIVDFANTVGTGVTSATISLTAFGTKAVRDGIVAGFGIIVNTNINAENGYTRIGTHGYSTPTTAGMVAWKSIGGDVNPSASWTGSSPAAGGIALQIKNKDQIHSRNSSRLSAALLNVVRRFNYWLRNIGISIPSISSVVRTIVGGVVARTVSVLRAGASSVSRLRELIRFSSVIRPQSSVVNRIRELVRTVSLAIRQSLVVRRIGSFLRTINNGRPIKAQVQGLRRLFRTIATSPFQSVSIFYESAVEYSTTLAYESALAVSGLITVSRIRVLARSASVVESIKTSVSRLRGLIRRVGQSVSRSFSVRRIASYIRRSQGSRTSSSSVSRIAWRIRRVLFTLSKASSVRRIGLYLRRIGENFSIKAIVNQAIAGTGLFVRSVVLRVAQTSQVRRIASYLRRVVSTLARNSTVSRLRSIGRGAVLVRGLTSSVKRSAWYIRSVYYYLFPIEVVVSDDADAGHANAVRDAIIAGYGSNIRVKTVIQVDGYATAVALARETRAKVLVRSFIGVASYISESNSIYPSILTFWPLGSNSFVELFNLSSVPVSVTSGAGDTQNNTAYGNGLEFWDDDNNAVGDVSSYSNGVIAGKLLRIQHSRGGDWWDARYAARQTASNGGVWDKFNGYGKINVAAAIAFGGSSADPYSNGNPQLGQVERFSVSRLRFLTRTIALIRAQVSRVNQALVLFVLTVRNVAISIETKTRVSGNPILRLIHTIVSKFLSISTTDGSPSPKPVNEVASSGHSTIDNLSSTFKEIK